MKHDRIRSKAGLALVAKVRGLCGDYPGVTEEIDKFGHTSFRVAKKPFIIIGESEETVTLNIKADPGTQAILIKQGAFYRTPYIGQHGWVGIDAPGAGKWKQLAELIEDAYRSAAPPKLRAQFDER